ncbi:response regulator transcription factor [Gorillibacterium massiliense]|uniref:response regulator transcription factor n=1 Tax=Gorillibacterium massiliense TaxID=1280390 RepID=UPI0004B3B7DC|nr:response regulator transcription factor [Gorillibacterium massiliense]
MTHILLVDDHPSVREGTKAILEKEEDMEVTAVSSAVEALEVVRSSQSFDVMLFDLNMTPINGLELTKRMSAINSDFIILIYTGYEISPHFNLLVEAGVSGFVSKTATRDQLVDAIRCSMRGEALIPVPLLRQLRRNDVRLSTSSKDNQLEEASINDKEQEILAEVAKGRSNRELAQILLMSQRTVEYNLTRIFAKLNVKSRAEAIAEARRIGLISDMDWTQ